MKNKLKSIHHPVFWPSVILIIVFIVYTIANSGKTFSNGLTLVEVFVSIKNSITDSFGWLFVLSVNIFLFFAIYLAFSKYGKIRIGGKEAKPEFSTYGWFAMLFSAGMGIGLLYWSVAEPVLHFIQPPHAEAGTNQAAKEAMNFTFLHWGFHAWGIYALLALALAFFTFNLKLPLTVKSIFYPLLKHRIHGPIGNIIDILAVLATLFGLATSLGLGAKQINAGLHYLFGVESGIITQVIIISIITGFATISVVLGLKKGVQKLSMLNVKIAGVFLLALIIVGPTLFIFDSFIQNTGYFIGDFLAMGTWTESFQSSEGDSWQNSWTLFYWAWWISWSPFVSIFIARISNGRTVKEFILGVLIVPSIVTFFWLSTFGGSAIHLILEGNTEIADAVNSDYSTALFVFLEQFPLAELSSFLGILLVTSFFVTSSDSGSLVVDSLAAGGVLEAPVGQRIFWALMEGAVAIALLIGGGLKALQTAAITTGLPFTFILLIMCYSLQKGLNNYYNNEYRN